MVLSSNKDVASTAVHTSRKNSIGVIDTARRTSSSGIAAVSVWVRSIVVGVANLNVVFRDMSLWFRYNICKIMHSSCTL